MIIACDAEIYKMAKQMLVKKINSEYKLILGGDKGANIALLSKAGKESTEIINNLNKGIAIINSDDFSLSRQIGGFMGEVITCGLGLKSTVTASSIVAERLKGITFNLCIQRTIKDIDALDIEPQEFTVNMQDKGIDINNALLIITAGLVCGVRLKALKNI